MFYILDEFNRLTGHDFSEKFKEHMIVFAEGIIMTKCTINKGLLDTFNTQIADSRTKELETCKYLKNICSSSIC